jgi:hypothetical protein
MTKAGNQRMGKRNGSESNAHSKASPSDRKHDEKQVREEKSIKSGTEQAGKLKEWQGGSKK